MTFPTKYIKKIEKGYDVEKIIQINLNQLSQFFKFMMNIFEILKVSSENLKDSDENLEILKKLQKRRKILWKSITRRGNKLNFPTNVGQSDGLPVNTFN